MTTEQEAEVEQLGVSEEDNREQQKQYHNS